MNILIYGHKSKFSTHFESYEIFDNSINHYHKIDHTLDVNPNLTGYDTLINFRRKNQITVLENVFSKWKYEEKTIVNIGSRSKYPNLSKGYRYSSEKAALSHAASNMRFLSDKKCRIIDINPGLIESHLPSLTWHEVSKVVWWCISLPIHIEVGELNLWEKTPYNIISSLKDNL